MNSLPLHFGKHFFGSTNPATPKEILSLVTAYVPPREKPAVGLVNKDWHDVYIHDAFWQNAGAKNYIDFVDRMNALPDKLKELVCNQVYDLSFAEEIQQILLLNFEGRKAYFSEFFPGFSDGMTFGQLYHLLGDDGVQALKENLITPEQAAGMNAVQLRCLLWDNGIQALRENLISVEQVAGMNRWQLAHLLRDSGVQALRENLITPEQASGMDSGQLKYLLQAIGVLALKEKLITVKLAADMNWKQLKHLLTNNGVQALRENRITPEQAADMNYDQLANFLEGNPLCIIF